MNEKLLQLNEVSASYSGLTALDKVSLYLDQGEIVALMGPNGAGKSTVLKTIFGLTQITGGEILWRNSPINPVPYKIVALGISYVPQGRRVFTRLTVYENLEIGGFTVKNKSEVKKRINECMEIFPILRQKQNTKSGTLSGGQQQMLALARGLMTDPKILLLDEPSLGLAPKVVKEVFVKIKEINQKRGTAVMVVEHNIKSLLEISDRAYVLDKGKVATHGDAAELLNSGVIERIFLNGR